MNQQPPTYDRLVAAELRAEAGRRQMNATQIAAVVRVSPDTVRRRLRGDGRIYFDQLDAIARALGTTGRAIQARALNVLEAPRVPSRRERAAS